MRSTLGSDALTAAITGPESVAALFGTEGEAGAGRFNLVARGVVFPKLAGAAVVAATENVAAAPPEQKTQRIEEKKKHTATFNQRNQPIHFDDQLRYISNKKNRVPVEEGRGGRGGNTLRGGT